MLKLLSFRAFVVLGVAIAMFAAVGYAASFAVSGPGGGDTHVINAEGGTLVDTCTRGVTIEKSDFWKDASDGQPGHGGFYVGTVLAKTQPFNPEGGSRCDGLQMCIVLTGAHGEALATECNAIGPKGGSDPDFSEDEIRVEDLRDIHVLISDIDQSGNFPN